MDKPKRFLYVKNIMKMKRLYKTPQISTTRITFLNIIATSNNNTDDSRTPDNITYGGSNANGGPTVAESKSWFGTIVDDDEK